MPLFITYSRFTRDSQLLRRAAGKLGWETLRLEGWQLPEWVDTEEHQDVVIFATMPEAAEIAARFNRTLLGCGTEWLVGLPSKFVKRDIAQMPLVEAVNLPGGKFVKSAISKHLLGRIRTRDQLRDEACQLSPDLIVYVAEPVSFLVEYRCFFVRREVSCLSPYRRYGQDFDESRMNMNEPESEVADAREFADAVLGLSDVDCPPAFVVDIGLIDGRGWAVVEANECWASGIYHCDPVKVLDVLKAACVPNELWTALHERWNFAAHYAAAAPK